MPAPDATIKTEARAHAKSLLAAVSAADRRVWSESICQRIMAWDALRSAKTVMLYVPIGPEVDVRSIGARILKNHGRVCLPRANWERKGMEAVPVPSLDQGLVAGRYGILEPPVEAPAVASSEIDLIMVPGLAFDRSGNRLGRGAGFYDRFLADRALKAMTCGVAFDIQVLDKLPTDQWDIQVHAVATESRLIITSRKPAARD